MFTYHKRSKVNPEEQHKEDELPNSVGSMLNTRPVAQKQCDRNGNNVLHKHFHLKHVDEFFSSKRIQTQNITRYS